MGGLLSITETRVPSVSATWPQIFCCRAMSRSIDFRITGLPRMVGLRDISDRDGVSSSPPGAGLVAGAPVRVGVAGSRVGVPSAAQLLICAPLGCSAICSNILCCPSISLRTATSSSSHLRTICSRSDAPRTSRSWERCASSWRTRASPISCGLAVPSAAIAGANFAARRRSPTELQHERPAGALRTAAAHREDCSMSSRPARPAAALAGGAAARAADSEQPCSRAS